MLFLDLLQCIPRLTLCLKLRLHLLQPSLHLSHILSQMSGQRQCRLQLLPTKRISIQTYSSILTTPTHLILQHVALTPSLKPHQCNKTITFNASRTPSSLKVSTIHMTLVCCTIPTYGCGRHVDTTIMLLPLACGCHLHAAVTDKRITSTCGCH